MDVLVVVNAAARGGAAALADEVTAVCARLGARVQLLAPRGDRRAVEEIAAALGGSDRWAALLAVGGDGTVGTCAEALAGSAVPMAIVPAGTGNSLYRALWADRAWPDVLAEALTGAARVRDLDLLAVRGEPSGAEAVAMLGASAGLVAEILRASEALSGVSGRERYAAATGPALETHTPFPTRVVLDGAELFDGAASLVAVGGARHRSGTFELLPRSVLDDGRLDVCVIGGVGAARLVELAGAIVAGEHLAQPEVAYGQGVAVRIESTDGAPLVFEHDGDVWPTAERAVTVAVDGSVEVLAPAEPVAG